MHSNLANNLLDFIGLGYPLNSKYIGLRESLELRVHVSPGSVQI